MKSINAITIRQSLGSVLNQLDAGGEPVLVTRDRKPVAALISMEDFEARFVDRLSEQAVRERLSQLDQCRVKPRRGHSPMRVLRDLRDSR